MPQSKLEKVNFSNRAVFFVPQYRVETVVNKEVLDLLSHVGIYNPLIDTTLDQTKIEDAKNLLAMLKLSERFNQTASLKGVEAYEDRFVTGIASLAFIVAGLHPIKSELKRQQYADFLFYLGRSGMLPYIEEEWKRKRDRFGILTPPAVPFGISFDDWLPTYLDPNSRDVEVYSVPNRYSAIVSYLNKIAPKERTIIDIASGPSDFLLETGNLSTVSIAVDRLSPEAAVNDENMIVNRFSLDQSGNLTDPNIHQQVFLDELRNSGIIFLKGDMFSDSWTKKLNYTNLPEPVIVTCLNGVYPHYTEKSILRFLNKVMKIQPDYIVLGGGVPGLTFLDIKSQSWIPGIHFKIFKIQQRSAFDLHSNFMQDTLLQVPVVSGYSIASEEIITM